MYDGLKGDLQPRSMSTSPRQKMVYEVHDLSLTGNIHGFQPDGFKVTKALKRPL